MFYTHHTTIYDEFYGNLLIKKEKKNEEFSTLYINVCIGVYLRMCQCSACGC